MSDEHDGNASQPDVSAADESTGSGERPTESRGRSILVGAVMLAVVLGLFIVLLATRDDSAAREVDSPLLGGAAPEIIGTTLTGDSYNIDDERGKWVVVNFFSPTCVPCVVEHPELINFSEAHAATGDASVVSVAFASREVEVRNFFEQRGGDWPVLAGSSESSAIALNYVTAQVPETYIVSPRGRVVAKLIGGITEEQLDEVIERASATATTEVSG
jgi:cytochrome c biogenesis protein CcmG/thiol:disulfide interchange protein DsbE